MRIIVGGCGKVGTTIIERLSTEGHDVAVIDTDSKVLKDITETYDVMGVVGNCASYSVLTQAGIEDTDLLIAVTDSDELNLLCCLFARKAGDCKTIARVRNPVYANEVAYIKDELGMAMTINPEAAAAMEISRLLRFPSAMKIDTFAKGRVELMQVEIPEGSLLDGMQLMDLPADLRGLVLVVADIRDGEVTIPNGRTVLKAGDTISIIAQQRNARKFFRRIGVVYHRIKNTMIIGGGKIAYYLARILVTYGIEVKIVEKDAARCHELSEAIPEAMVLNEDATDHDFLLSEGLETCESFVTLTGIDEENIFLSMYAKRVNKNAKIITKVNRITTIGVTDQLHLGSMIQPKNITAEYILQYVRAMQNSIGSNVETLYNIVEGKAEALEFTIHEGAPVVGIPLMNLRTKDNVLVACIIRQGKILFANGQSTIEVGDSVIVVTTHSGFDDIKDILKDTLEAR